MERAKHMKHRPSVFSWWILWCVGNNLVSVAFIFQLLMKLNYAQNKYIYTYTYFMYIFIKQDLTIWNVKIPYMNI